jgi:hypothetical protein
MPEVLAFPGSGRVKSSPGESNEPVPVASLFPTLPMPTLASYLTIASVITYLARKPDAPRFARDSSVSFGPGRRRCVYQPTPTAYASDRSTRSGGRSARIDTGPRVAHAVSPWQSSFLASTPAGVCRFSPNNLTRITRWYAGFSSYPGPGRPIPSHRLRVGAAIGVCVRRWSLLYRVRSWNSSPWPGKDSNSDDYRVLIILKVLWRRADVNVQGPFLGFLVREIWGHLQR